MINAESPLPIRSAKSDCFISKAVQPPIRPEKLRPGFFETIRLLPAKSCRRHYSFIVVDQIQDSAIAIYSGQKTEVRGVLRLNQRILEARAHHFDPLSVFTGRYGLMQVKES